MNYVGGLKLSIDNRVKVLMLNASGIIVLGIVSVMGFNHGRNMAAKPRIEYDKLYVQTLRQYGDTDGDGSISAKEMDAFDRELFQDKGVTLIHGFRVRYSDGTKAPPETKIKWLKEYISSKNAEE